MVKKCVLATTAVLCLLAVQSTARTQYGPTAFDFLDTGYGYISDACASGACSDYAYYARDNAYYSLYYAFCAYAYDDPEFYYWACYCGQLAYEYAVEDYWVTGDLDSLYAYWYLSEGASYAWDAFAFGG